TGLLRSGTNFASGGYWNGIGISSATAAGDAAHLTALGVLLNNVGGQTIYAAGTSFGPFDNQATSGTDVLVKYTYYGDADLSGGVDGGDYSLTDNGFNMRLSGWSNGDFNYDTVIDGADYALIDNVFNAGPTPLAVVAQPAATAVNAHTDAAAASQ